MLTERHLIDFPSLHVPETEFLEVPTSELVQVVDALFVAPVDDELSSVVVCPNGGLQAVRLLVVEVQFARGAETDSKAWYL